MIRWKYCSMCLIRRTILILSILTIQINSLTVDNQLVASRNDCFERIALEGMLPFEKAFRTEDTNSLRMCKEKCLQEGDKCQSMAFGVHRRGNGTCQLSKEKFKLNGGRPNGIIFDPDFDLYARKTNCFDLGNDNTQADNIAETNGYGNSLAPTTPVFLSTRPSSGTPIFIVDPTPTLHTTTTLQDDSTKYPAPPPTTVYSSDVGDSVGPTTIYTQQPPSPPSSPATFGSSLPPSSPLPTPSDTPLSTSNTGGGDRLYFSQDIYPFLKYPSLYEPNYPAPNEELYPPGGTARPVLSISFGNGNGFSYGRPGDPNNPQTTMQPQDAYTPMSQRPNDNRDQMRPLPMGGHDDATSPSYGNFPRPASSLPPPFSQRPTTDHMQGSSTPYGLRPQPSQSTGDFMDFTNRPDAPASGGRPPMSGYDSGRPQRPTYDQERPQGSGFDNRRPQANGYGSNNDANSYGSYDTNYMRRNGTAAGRPELYDDKRINTYFNPEDYYGANKKRPGSYEADDRVATYDRNPMKACFRRVLAGKRVAPHWVRRTIACERVEECMRECGREKRFTCEGFNYRLDPSGHGQGDCELIEIPLAQIDLYSSPNRKDSNLLRHPDYDYYERDRNAPPSCRYNMCNECPSKPPSSGHYNKPSSGWSEKPYRDEHYVPSPPSGGYFGRPASGSSGSSSLEHYGSSGPSGPPPPASHSGSYESHSRPPYSYEHQSGSYEFSSHGASYYEHSSPGSYGSSGSGHEPIDRYDSSHRDHYRPSKYPSRWETIPSSSGYDSGKDRLPPPPYRPHHEPADSYHHSGPAPPPPPPQPSAHNYLDRDGPPVSTSYKKPSDGGSKYVPYLIGTDNEWGSYGGSYGGNYNKQTAHWGDPHNRRKDPANYNYYDVGPPAPPRREPPHETNSVIGYPGPSYGGGGGGGGGGGSGGYGKYDGGSRDRFDYKHQWTRRPGPDECSAKTSEGFRFNKKIVKHVYSAPTLTECERLCSGQDGFICHTYSYRYATASRDNCMLCDRPINRLDYYDDIEPDRDYDIYSMTDDLNTCNNNARNDGPRGGGPIGGVKGGGGGGPRPTTALAGPKNAQCFFRAIDATRFFKSIVRDSLTVRSVGECEMECIKSTKFTCRAFAFRYNKQRHASVIDNCQLSDWPVRDMDKERHLILDATFDIFERASYGHGCEIQPIVDEKHKKFCYLGYGSPAKLLPTAIKKVITVPSELECKKECIRFRDTTSFKCYSFSYGSRKTTFNCEMSDHDQTELKLNTHYMHTDDRDFWLFAWNPFDYTCRDKTNTIGGSRVNNNRRMDIFRETGDMAWRHYSVSGKPCRRSSPCEKNLVTGFYSCEIEGGEIGSWDYCCKIDHPCGYSKGFDYPWCFVGDEPDQWRKCSDRYYPGNNTLTHSNINAKPIKSSEKHKHSDSYSSAASNSEEFQKPPHPGGLQSLSDFTAARLWPVTYLYSEGPPNSTELSNFVDCNKESC